MTLFIPRYLCTHKTCRYLSEDSEDSLKVRFKKIAENLLFENIVCIVLESWKFYTSVSPLMQRGVGSTKSRQLGLCEEVRRS